MIKVIVADEIDESGLDPLSGKNGFKLVYVKNDAQLQKEIGDSDALLVRSKTQVNDSLIGSGKKLKFIGRAGVGVDNIDVDSASKRGIVVANVPGGNTISAAEHTFALILALSRNIPQSHASVKSGLWERNKFIGTELQGKTLGLLGFGRIGKEVAKRAQSFEMKVIAYDPFVSEMHMRANGVQSVLFDQVLEQSDYLSLHLPVNDQTKKIINAAALSKLKADARLINCARGELIDEAALIEVLKNKKIKGAALDVYSSEPPKNTELFKLENLILTPHLGASTEEAQVKVAKELSLSLRDYFEKGVARGAVNLPSIEPELLEKINPYLQLAEKLGKFLAQITEGGIQEVKIDFVGDFSGPMRNVLTISILKGVLSSAMGNNEINWVNALPIAKERGIKILDSASTDAEDFTSLISVRIKTDKQSRSIAGTLLSKGAPRIVRIDDLSVDILPEGHLLVFTNIDRPGVVGFIGTLLGENQINIAEFQVGRKKVGGEAVSILKIDSPVSENVIQQIKKFSGITNVWIVSL